MPKPKHDRKDTLETIIYLAQKHGLHVQIDSKAKIVTATTRGLSAPKKPFQIDPDSIDPVKAADMFGRHFGVRIEEKPNDKEARTYRRRKPRPVASQEVRRNRIRKLPRKKPND